jgi:carbonic anhydrase
VRLGCIHGVEGVQEYGVELEYGFREGGEVMDKKLTGEWTRRQFFAGLTAAGVAGGLAWSGAPVFAQTKLSGEAALRELMAGNERFVAGNVSSFPEDLKILKAKTASKQEPFAAVLACADSRMPVELVFDQTIGHVFVTRVAGNMITPEIIASLEYGVAVLGIRAILILGHMNCGAISATIQAKEVPGQISVLYQHLMPGIAGANGDIPLAIKMNAAYQAKLLAESSTVIAKAIKDDGAKVVSGTYELATGKVTLGV